MALPTETVSTIELVPVGSILPGKNDRSIFNAEKLTELASSIQTNGLAQPITVRPLPGGMYQIVAGERRFRALSELIKASYIPCIIRDLDDEEAAAIMLAENTGRVDLNAIDEALAYHTRIKEFAWTEEQVAETAGVSKDRVRRRLQLLSLIPEAQHLIATDNLPLGHGECMAKLDSNRQISALRILQSSLHPLTLTAFRGICDQFYGEQQQEGLFTLEAFWMEQVQQEHPLPRTGKRAITGAPVRHDLPPIEANGKDSVGSILDRYIADLLAAGHLDEAGAVGNLYTRLVQGNWVSVPGTAQLLQKQE